ncbi:MAG: hypothetical protein QXW41_07430 [Fervidicoccaceae archaeon]
MVDLQAFLRSVEEQREAARAALETILAKHRGSEAHVKLTQVAKALGLPPHPNVLSLLREAIEDVGSVRVDGVVWQLTAVRREGGSGRLRLTFTRCNGRRGEEEQEEGGVACPLCGARFRNYTPFFNHAKSVVRELRRQGVVEVVEKRQLGRTVTLYSVGGRLALGFSNVLAIVKELHPQLSCEQLLGSAAGARPPRRAGPLEDLEEERLQMPEMLPLALRGAPPEVESKVLSALREVLGMQRGRVATVRAKRLVLLLHGYKPYLSSCRKRAHPYELALVVRTLRKVREVDGWRLVEARFRKGWVFTFARS